MHALTITHRSLRNLAICDFNSAENDTRTFSTDSALDRLGSAGDCG